MRPISPRGLVPFAGDLSVIWMRGPYDSYVTYRTSIAASTTDDANAPPVADGEPAVRSGPAPLAVRFDGSASRDPDGAIADRQWDFRDGSGGSGAEVSHSYTSGGRFFPTLTVTDNSGARSVLVEEIVVGGPAAPTVHTGGASGAVAHGAVDPENQATQWWVEYGPTREYGAVTQTLSLPADDALHQVAAELPGLEPGRLYHYRVVATNASGSSSGEDRALIAGPLPGSDAYTMAVLDTPGLAAYWRLGELSGSSSREERTGASGPFEGRFVLGQVGVLGPLGNTAASFDGSSGALAAQGPALVADATLEGWFSWPAGVGTLRDHTGSGGWLLAFNSSGSLAYRLGGRGFVTGLPIEDVRDGRWHHIVATKAGASAALYVDGQLVHSGTGAGSTPSVSPWHVMRNGTNGAFSEGEADEVALYSRALSAGEVRAHHEHADALAAVPLPTESPPPVAEPPAAGAAHDGAGTTSPARKPVARGLAFVRDGRLVARAAAGAPNRLLARRRGAGWRSPTPRRRCAPAPAAGASDSASSVAGRPGSGGWCSSAATATTGLRSSA